jgi:hypothetical protein
VDGACVLNEVETRPGITGEEFGGEEITFETIAATAGGNKVAGRVLATFGKRKNVVDRGEVEIDGGGAVDTAATAITHHGVFDRALLVADGGALAPFGPASDSRKAWQANMVIVSTPRQFHLAGKATPRTGSHSRGGASRKP